MQETGVINVEKRVKTGSCANKRLRHSGYVPAILYGKRIESIPVTVKKTELRSKLIKYGRNAIFNLNIPNESSYSVLIKDIQNDPVIEDYMHVDFQQISLDEEIKTEVFIKIIGREVVEAAKLHVIQQLDSISVKCLPQDIPESIEIDISKMGIGDNVAVKDIVLSDNVTVENEPEQVIITVNEVKQYVEEESEDSEESTVDEESEASEEA